MATLFHTHERIVPTWLAAARHLNVQQGRRAKNLLLEITHPLDLTEDDLAVSGARAAFTHVHGLVAEVMGPGTIVHPSSRGATAENSFVLPATVVDVEPTLAMDTYAPYLMVTPAAIGPNVDAVLADSFSFFEVDTDRSDAVDDRRLVSVLDLAGLHVVPVLLRGVFRHVNSRDLAQTFDGRRFGYVKS